MQVFAWLRFMMCFICFPWPIVTSLDFEMKVRNESSSEDFVE